MSEAIFPTPSHHRRRKFLAFTLFALVGSVTTVGHTGTPVRFPLTSAQTSKVAADTKGKRGWVVVKVRLTERQFKAIKERFPKLASYTMAGKVLAPYVPAGTVLSAAVSGLGQTRNALGTLSG
jgi:hypothetical protein